MSLSSKDIRACLVTASPVMLAYVAIGIPCGVMESQVGFSPLLAFAFSATYYSGAGQFMIPNLWMAGTPLLATFLSVAFVSSRQMLYSAAFSPYVGGEGLGRVLGFAAQVTDETFGINLGNFSSGEGWSLKRATVVNVACNLSWSLANLVGAALGSVLDLPTDVMSFGMTAIFVCLLMGQRWSRSTLAAAAGAMVGVAACKLVGFADAAILLGAVAGVVCGLVAGEGESR